MTGRIVSKLGIAAALTIGIASAAAAQVRSQTPIKISKEAPGEVAVRVDTVHMTRVDTVRVYRTDTVRVNIPGAVTTNTVTRYDTVTVETLPGYVRRPGGFYFGLGGGALYPWGSIDRAQMPGYSLQAQMGVDPIGSPLGFRADVNWARPNEMADFAGNRARPEIMNVSADLKLKLPMLSRALPNFAVYAIGGGNYIRYKDLLIELNTPTAGTLANNIAPSDNEWHDKFGWNAGGGLSLGWGKTELFVESRFISFKPANADYGHQIPFVVGFNWY